MGKTKNKVKMWKTKICKSSDKQRHGERTKEGKNEGRKKMKEGKKWRKDKHEGTKKMKEGKK